MDSEHLSEMTEEEYEVNFAKPHLKGFVKIDAKYLIPFFTRRFTQQVLIIIGFLYTHIVKRWGWVSVGEIWEKCMSTVINQSYIAKR